MSLPTAGFKSELRSSAKPVISALGIAGLALILVYETPPAQPNMPNLVLVLFMMTIATWIVDSWKPLLGKWFVILDILVVIWLLRTWFHIPGSLVLTAIPVTLTASLIGVAASGIVGAAVSAFMLLSVRIGAPGATFDEIGLSLISTWSAVAAMYMAYHGIDLVSEWAWGYYLHTRALLEEARDQQVQLHEALGDAERAYQQLARLNRITQDLRRAAEDARRAKERFVANVSHELRTPLHMIVGFSRILVQPSEAYPGPLPTAVAADLEVILRNAEHLSSLIDDVLELSQVEARKMALVKERVGLLRLVQDAIVSVRPLFESKGLYLEMAESEQLPLVFCDPTRIREVILNLLSNAGRFTEQGGVRVRAWQEGDEVLVSVADTGPGIAETNRDRVFRSFEQLDISRARRYAGTGLGLSISKSLVELHKGTMWFESQTSRGTTFFFRLPIDEPAPIPRGPSRWLSPSWEYQERTRATRFRPVAVRPRVVVSEAGQIVQRLLARHLDGVEVEATSNLEDALEEIRRVPAKALLVNDESVPEALGRLLTSSDLPQGTPVVICSVPGSLEGAASLGVYDYLVKPVSREALLGSLKRLHLRGKTILVVDDELDALQLFWRMLTSGDEEYRVLTATNGREALETLRDEHPDAVLLDLIMPDMDGFQFLAAIRNDSKLRDTPVVVVSARDPVGHAIVSNAVAIIQKDGFSVPDLLDLVQTVMGPLSPEREVATVESGPASTTTSPA